MPYIPPQNRPPIDEHVDRLAEEIASSLAAGNKSAEVSESYREAFGGLAGFIAQLEQDPAATPVSAAQHLAKAIVDTAKGYNQRGGWLGELNYAVTTLIQAVPHKMVEKGAWTEHLRYWLFAETVGALSRSSYDMHTRFDNDWIGNGLTGVFQDIKDEYKRRVNTAYEAAQILRSGDCYDMVPFRTQLVPAEINGVKGYTEVLLPKQQPKATAWRQKQVESKTTA